MSQHFRKEYERWIYRVFSGFIAISFGFTSIVPPTMAQAIPTILNLPVPGTMVNPTQAFSPIMMKGLMIHPQDALTFDFIIDEGDQKFSDDEFRHESTRLIKYFLTALTVQEKQMWVNLSPYEKDRIIPQDFGKTEMGRDLLAQDYLLKQLTASLMYPEKELGSEFWTRVHQRAKERFGTTDIPMNTFNKIWIVPESAEVFENVKGAVIVKNHLKVMLEEDYLALEANKNSSEHGLGDVKKEDLETISGVQSQVIKEILIPEIEREVNEGQTFTQLRQIYNAVILATWYKQALKESLLGRVYIDQAKTQGIEHADPMVNQKIYEQYVTAFQKGVYDYMKEDYDAKNQQVITQKYFSGGAKLGLKGVNTTQTASAAMLSNVLESGQVVRAGLNGDSAMKADSTEKEKLVVSQFAEEWMGVDILQESSGELISESVRHLIGILENIDFKENDSFVTIGELFNKLSKKMPYTAEEMSELKIEAVSNLSENEEKAIFQLVDVLNNQEGHDEDSLKKTAEFVLLILKDYEPYFDNKKNLETILQNKSRIQSDAEMLPQDVGGIDMNPAMLNMKKDREGKGVVIPLPLEPAGNWNNVEGFTPFIINVLPITNLPLLLGIKNNGADDKTPKTEVSYNLSFLATEPRQETATE